MGYEALKRAALRAFGMTNPIDTIASIVGEKGIVADPDDQSRYLSERRGRWPGKARLIVRPSSTREVAQIVETCAANKMPIVPQGGNTGLVGGQVPSGNEIVVSLERLNKIRDVDPLDRTLVAEAGCVLATIQSKAEAEGLLFPLSLASEGSAQIGGLISTNAGGTAVLRYGTMRNLVLGLEVVTPAGAVWNGLARLHKDNTGYSLRDAFIGAEGTLGIITAAVLKMLPHPRASMTLFLSVPNPSAAINLLRLTQQATGDMTAAFEIMSNTALNMVLKHGPQTQSPLSTEYNWYILTQIDGHTENELKSTVDSLISKAAQDGLILDGAIAQNERQAKSFWDLREGVSEAQRHEGVSLKHDVSVPVAKVPQFLEQASASVEKEVPGIRPVLFGHIGDGNMHFNLSQPENMGTEEYSAKREAVADMVHGIAHAMGGSFSAEHGVGLAKRRELETFKDPTALELMKNLKKAWDPHGIMNPGKLLP